MKQLKVEQIKANSTNPSMGELSFMLDGINRNRLNETPWKKYDYLPDVQFAIAYGNDSVFLKYYVDEKFIRAVNSKINSSVWEDSCVEFFIHFDDEKKYYNFEFNCIGAALVGYGETKSERELLPEKLIGQIKYQSVISNALPGSNIHWELIIAIPFTLFCYHQLNTLKEKKCRANFYKCGDQLPTPHFVSWSTIKSPEPNFHLPEFFGTLQFI